MAKAPGKSHREGISLIELTEIFPDEQAARDWFEGQVWPDGRRCPRCGCASTAEVKNEKPMPYRCRSCRQFFSVRTGTVLERSKLPLRKWAFGIYICATSLKGVSSMKLHRDLKVTQKTAWFMAHRIREAWVSEGGLFSGPVEVDEAFFGGLEKNKHSSKKLRAGRGAVGKTAVIAAKDRETGTVDAQVVPSTDAATLQPFVVGHSNPGATVYTDDHSAYRGTPGIRHQAVKHSIGEYVDGQAHTNGVESFWAMLKRGYHGTYHHLSPKHLQRYVDEFAGRHNIRNSDTIDQMNSIVAGMIGRRLMYRGLVRDS